MDICNAFIEFYYTLKNVSNAPMQRVYRILLNPITAFEMHTRNYFIEFY